MMLVLFPWIVLIITDSSFLAGLELAVSNIPLGLSFLLGYYLTKIRNKKALYVGSTTVRALTLLFIFIVFLTGNKLYELVSIFIGYFITSWTEDISSQIGGYWIKEFLDKNQYQKGFSLDNFLNMIVILISYIFAGTFIAIGINLAFPILILGFAISSIIRLFIKPRSDGTLEDKPHTFKEGFSFIWNDKIMRYLMIQALLISLAYGGFLLLIESLVKFRYGGSAFILTDILVIAMIGGAVGSILGNKIRGNPRVVMSTLIFVLIPLVLFIPFSPSYIFLIPDAFLIMISNQLHGVIFSTIYFKVTPKDYMLQVRGAHSTLTLFPTVVSSLIVGAVIEFVSLTSAFYFIAILTVAVLYFTWHAKEIGEMKIGEEN
jgi:hypothetical protein